MDFIFIFSIGSNALPKEEMWPHCEDPNTSYCNTTSLPLCPDCSLVECVPKIEASDCPEGTHWEDNIIWGCCPAYTRRIEVGSACGYTNGDEYSGEEYATTRELPCNLKMREGNGSIRITKEEGIIAPDSKNSIAVPVYDLYECGLDSNCVDNTCQLMNSEYVKCSKDLQAFKDWDERATEGDCSNDLTDNKNDTIMEWERKCTNKGRYSTIQSKSNQYQKNRDQFCSDPEGNRIFGESSAEDETITCMCSRKRWEMEQMDNPTKDNIGALFTTRNDVTIHCDDKGNFETLQCDNGFCWCMETLSNGRSKVVSRLLHENLKDQLPCVKNDNVPYQRRCETRTIAKAKVKAKMLKHGLNWQEKAAKEVKCDYDGSFAPVNYNVQGKLSCMDKMNQPKNNYNPTSDKDCSCARDPKSFTCDSKGNYQIFQKFEDAKGGTKYCIDRDGFRTTRQYDFNEHTECRIPKCECFSEKINGCVPSYEACKQCDENGNNCHECDECQETECQAIANSCEAA